jgi:uncharacterized protein YciI
MPQFVVIAYDGTDAGALDRRMAVRPAHLESIKPMVESGQLKAGGAILDDAGKMIGSVTICDFPDRAALDHWLATDPYIIGNVWQKIEVKPFRLAVLAKA